MVRSKNTMREDFREFRRARIMHYTFGSIKPWQWYTGFIMPFAYKFTHLAERLPVTSKDKRQTRKESMALGLGLVYFVVWVLVVHHGGRATQKAVSHRQNHRNPQSKNSCWCSLESFIRRIFDILQQNMLPRNDTTTGTQGRDPLSQASMCLHFVAGYACLFIGVAVGYKIVPRHTHRPMMGFSIFLLWAFGVFFSLYSLYVYRWYLRGAALRMTTSAKSADLDLEQTSLLVPLTSAGNHHSNCSNNFALSPTPPNSTRQPVGSGTIQQHQLQHKQQQQHTSARTETLTYCIAFVCSIGWGVWVRVTTLTENIPEMVLPLLCVIIPIVSLTVVFYRLPILWYQQGLLA